jgi:putative membrane-bound dehydrogenase-like protein
MKPILIFILLASPCFGESPLNDKNRPVATTAALTAAETAAKMQLPKGFHASVFAAEPDIVQPIGYTMDDRGRLWVLECTNYPDSPGKPKDRIVILENTDGDGSADKKSVFYDKVPFASGIAIGHGGVWVGSPPNLLFFPRRDDKQDVAAGEPEIVLDGWGADDTHETLNNFIWGPDGWLYGTQGVFTFSKVGKPGAPDSERVPMNAGIFRYHPDKKIFELYAEGGSNQWGLDWDDQGRGFFAACVISHMWQAIQGARYTRQAGRPSNPNTYDEIKTIARFTYEKRAYCGAMIYLGDTWPQQYRNTFFFNDIHMNILRNEKFVRNGSGNLSEKNGDFMTSGDPWYRGLSPQYGPDGSVYQSDWYDKVPCHQQKAFSDRSNGRIYKISYEGAKLQKVDLQKASDAELVAYQLHTNDWFVRHARLILAERGGNPAVRAALAKILTEHPDETRKLRALWALHVTHGLTSSLAKQSLESPLEYLRAWTIQLICEDRSPTADQLAKMIEMARTDSSPIVRMYLASAAGRIALDSRWPIIEALVANEQDKDDPNIPLLICYAAEPAVAADITKAANLLVLCKIPKLQEFISHRMAAIPPRASEDSVLPVLIRTLSEAKDPAVQASILRGMNAALKGKEGLVVSAGWDALYKQLKENPNEEVRQQSLALAASFGGTAALENLRKTLADPRARPADKESALVSLLDAKDQATLPLLLDLIKAPSPLRAASLRGLASYDNATIAPAIIATFASLDVGEKRDALNTLVARASGARAILTAIDSAR